MGALPKTAFPPGFRFGVATSAYQIEGAVDEDGRGESIWDRFCRTPGRVLHGDTGDVACDHYHRWEQDLDLIAELGLDSYRFSIAWPRIVPEGRGRVNQPGLDFYRRLAEGALERGIKPLATLYHWDLPQPLEDAGGWANRETAVAFAEYAEVVVAALGDVVIDWITQNEPWVSAVEGYAQGKKAPGRADWPTAICASHHLLLSHGLAVDAFRAVGPADGRIGITLNLAPMIAASETEADAAATERADGYHNRWYLDPVLRGRYPADMLELYASRGVDLGFIADGDEAIIGRPTDFLGVNYYSVGRIRDAGDAKTGDASFLGFDFLPARGPVTAMGWEIAPAGLTDLLLRLDRDYGPRRMMITENGGAFPEEPADSSVHDPARVAFLADHFEAARRAIAEGVDLEAYFVWSLLDNFEWESGYRPRFGIVRIDYDTQKRTPKDSALWYRDLVARHRSVKLGAA
ncbi:MAG TPA: GH1 family beta-glucosidase [Microbacteriaceae bacterium]|nr:GH1 family beta-glucosidase [Microbacteriaceae bacterium]